MEEDLLIIAIGSDHAGYEMKEKIKIKFSEKGYKFKDFGTNSTESVDYPDIMHHLAKQIDEGLILRGIVICGSGNGVAMTVNKYRKVRAAVCWNKVIAKFARLHNDANVIAIPARYISETCAFEITDMFLTTCFENGRHGKRVDKIAPPNL